MPPIRNYADVLTAKKLVAAGVLGATSAGTTGVDMGTHKSSMLSIDLVVGSDVATSFTVQHSYDNSTWADLLAVTDASLAATALVVRELTNHYRYLRVKWTRAAAGADSYWSILAVGKAPQLAPET